jgi:1-deoxy-D-xylulose-5-phosphate reductoisomerase
MVTWSSSGNKERGKGTETQREEIQISIDGQAWRPAHRISALFSFSLALYYLSPLRLCAFVPLPLSLIPFFSEVFLKRFIILGSTGSIGTSSLDVVSSNPDAFQVAGLAAGRSAKAIGEQILRFRPEAASLSDPRAAREVREHTGRTARIFEGFQGMLEMIRTVEADAVVNGLVGSAGMLPTIVALESGKDVLLANKETMVMAGKLVMETVRRTGRRIVPIDSEMSAIYQCLKGERHEMIRRLALTASGGPFVDCTPEQLEHVTLRQALNHPTWAMGTKNTIDSATMMNKGLEVIEASHLFDIPGDRIDVTIHRSSLTHSFVEFIDGSLLSQVSRPDMRLAIQYAMTDPERRPSPYGGLDFTRPFSMTFEPPDAVRFPCLALAYETLARGGTAPAAMNGANERAVEAFVDGKLPFMGIPAIIKRVVGEHDFRENPEIEELTAVDSRAKREVEKILEEGK